jgi:hypothetical protein
MGMGVMSEQGRGALPLGPSPKAQPLESTSFRQGEGAASRSHPIWPGSPSPCLKLQGSKGRALSGVEGQSPSPCLSTTPTPITVGLRA